MGCRRLLWLLVGMMVVVGSSGCSIGREDGFSGGYLSEIEEYLYDYSRAWYDGDPVRLASMYGYPYTWIIDGISEPRVYQTQEDIENRYTSVFQTLDYYRYDIEIREVVLSGEEATVTAYVHMSAINNGVDTGSESIMEIYTMRREADRWFIYQRYTTNIPA